MNLLDPWNVAFFVGWVVYFGIRHVFIGRTKGEVKVVSRMDGLERFLLGLMVSAVLVLPVVYLFTPVLSFADYGMPVAVRGSGVVLMAGSLWLFWRSHADLGKNWSVSLEIREGHGLVSDGVYRRVRHPMYTSIWMWGLAQGMVLENWLAGWAVLPAFAAMYFIRLPREEGMMLEKFGGEYEGYMRRTGRLVPKVFGRP